MHWTTTLTTIASALALFRVARLPGRRYIWFCVYLAFIFSRDIWLVSLLRESRRERYFAHYQVSAPFVGFLWIMMALELYRNVSVLYPGLERKTWAAVAATIAILLTWVSLVEDHSNPLKQLAIFHRAMATLLAVSIGLLSLLFSYFRNNLPRNSVIHAQIMAAYFVTQSIAYFFAERFGIGTREVNEFWTSVARWGAAVCYIAWALLLKNNGETRPPIEREFSDPDVHGSSQQASDITRKARNIGRGNTAG